jgi:hypothetical protein
MERAGRIITKWKLCADCVEPSELARAAWPAAVGKTISAHSAATALVRGRLVVEVEDQIWYKQLAGLRRQILVSLEKVLGEAVVTEIEFRLAIPRIQPKREERRLPLIDGRPDEADGIESPALRRLYKLARKRATA